MLRVLHISHISAPTPPPGYGGTELVVDILARGLLKKGYDVEVIGVKNPNYGYDYMFHSTFEKPIRKPRVYHKVWHGLYSAITSLHADIVHLHMQSVLPVFILHKVFLDKPVLLTLHADLKGYGLVSYVAKRLRIPLVAISKSQARRMRIYGFNIVDVIYHGIEVDKYPFSSSKEDYLLFLGRIDESKGTHIAVKIARKLNEKLVIVGPIVNRSYFDKNVLPYIGDKIVYMGEVDFNTKVYYLSKAKALIYPVMYEEFFGLVLVEALACGTPVIGFKRGSLLEIIEHGVNGFLASNEEELASYIKTLNTIDPRNCRGIVEEKFSANTMISKYEHLYTALMER